MADPAGTLAEPRRRKKRPARPRFRRRRRDLYAAIIKPAGPVAAPFPWKSPSRKRPTRRRPRRKGRLDQAILITTKGGGGGGGAVGNLTTWVEDGRPVAFLELARAASYAEDGRTLAYTETVRAVALVEDGRASSWTAPKMATLVKRAGELRTYTMDFSNLPEIVAGAALASVTSVTATPSGLTIGTTAVSGNKVTARLSGGTDGVTYQLVFTAADNNSPADTLVGIGYLLIDDQ